MEHVRSVLQSEKGLIIPLEVKTINHIKSRSLNNYMKEFNPKFRSICC